MSLVDLLLLPFYLYIAIVVHELGHYLVARAYGFRISDFVIGEGPKIFSFKRNNTEYIFNLIPGEGRVRMDIEPEKLSRQDKLGVCAVCLGGPFLNFVAAVLAVKLSFWLGLTMFFCGLGNLFPLPGSDGQQFIAYLWSAFKNE